MDLPEKALSCGDGWLLLQRASLVSPDVHPHEFVKHWPQNNYIVSLNKHLQSRGPTSLAPDQSSIQNPSVSTIHVPHPFQRHITVIFASEFFLLGANLSGSLPNMTLLILAATAEPHSHCWRYPRILINREWCSRLRGHEKGLDRWSERRKREYDFLRLLSKPRGEAPAANCKAWLLSGNLAIHCWLSKVSSFIFFHYCVCPFHHNQL